MEGNQILNKILNLLLSYMTWKYYRIYTLATIYIAQNIYHLDQLHHNIFIRINKINKEQNL